jgi:cysteine synthase A
MKTAESIHPPVAEEITEIVGETPILHLKRIAPPDGADLYAKLEYLNPGGSIKDRAAIGIIQRAEQEGKLRRGSTIFEATAGNTGIGLALIGVSRGYKVVLFVPEKFSQEKVMIMRALGAEVTRTPDAEGMEGAIQRMRDADYHYQTTGKEIFEQMEGRVDAVVIGAGTGGTFTGVARYVKERNPQALAIAVETVGSVLGGGPKGTHKIEGIGASFIPKTFDASLADQIIAVSDPDAFNTVKELAAKEGVLAGSSSGANVFAALQVARRLGKGKRVVTIIPDSAERYLSKKIFEGGI